MNIKSILLLLSLFYLPTNAQQRTISVDVNKVKGELSPSYLYCIGAGRANEGLRADWQAQLKEVQQEIGFKYIRFHGILSDDMGVYFEDQAGTPIYNWQYVDRLYDFLLTQNIKPIVELSFMPSALASDDKTVFWWKGNVTPPKDYAKWNGLITAFVKHLEERYGKEEVKTWLFELWNEPNHPAFFISNNIEFPNKLDAYMKLYSETAKAVKLVSTDYKVGGPATSGTAWISDFIELCVANNWSVDFVSTHAYGVKGDGLDEFGTKKLILRPDLDVLPSRVANSKQDILKSPRPDLPLHFTEWNTSYSPADLIHDTYFNAAYILNVLKKSENEATSMSYWTFTDIFEEAGPPKTPFHGGFGLINLQDIKKPSYFAYEFLAGLGNKELTTDDQSAIVCKDDKGNVQALFWNLTNIDFKGSYNNEYFGKEVPANSIGDVTLKVNNLQPGTYNVQVYQTGYLVNDAYTKYIQMGSPSQITKAQEKQLKEASENNPVEELTVTIKDGKFAKTLKIKENDVFFMTMTKM
ncbi:GH39 family glycosyl hydrolase [Polaribacter glomeratus]|uniref:Glycoside hydrolase n=1 Tax=Polaribacter glomeratus TaxID=102 RepID=A0A2S7WG38_9FLAO|nr:glycoside hydrolase [Polaribacter glomeratus]PQJ76598.1 glycoside hydrolase [Polaribacter glomeratus]TXD67563.1 glycoside hydrolase [Polaribacter glomeratus]